MSKRITLATAIATVLTLASCSSAAPTTSAGDGTQPPTDTVTPDATTSPRRITPSGPGSSIRAYERFGDCDEMLSWTKERLLERVTPYGLDPIGWYAGIEDGAPMSTDAAPAATEAAAADNAAAAPVPTRAGGTSTTNTQEVGVDEGDIAETDGRFVYSIIDGMLRSVDLDTSTLVSEEPLDMPASNYEMILDTDSMLVVGVSYLSNGFGETIADRYSVAAGVPTLVSRTHLEGTPLATRSIDGTARIVLAHAMTSRIPFVQPRYGASPADNLDKAHDANKQVIEDLTVDDLLPRAFEEQPGGSTGPLRQSLDCTTVGHPGEFSGFGLTWIAEINLRDGQAPPTGAAGVIADSGSVYASARNLYVATTRWPDLATDVIPINPPAASTAIHSFDLSGASGAAYIASGTVDGLMLNQYSMSEHGGFLRVATTSDSDGFGGDRAAGLHILERQADTLHEVGSLGGLGKGEQIQAVRFNGDVGFVVTFRQTDPLFVLDLSDPHSPKLSGELKIPGFSSYLHPLGDGLLLGVGYSGTESGLTGGTQLSLFDVNDPTQPQLVTTVAIGESTEAAFDPHAFLYWPETGDIVVPKELVCPIGDREACTSAVIARLDPANRTITETGRLFQWFPIRRSMVANGALVTISAGGLKRWDLANDYAELADVRFDIPGTDAELTLP
jgi:hypothetical protein